MFRSVLTEDPGAEAGQNKKLLSSNKRTKGVDFAVPPFFIGENKPMLSNGITAFMPILSTSSSRELLEGDLQASLFKKSFSK